MTNSLRPAAFAFDAVAKEYDLRFGEWGSVNAQRRAVRSALLREFPEHGYILEMGGGTGEDATFLVKCGRRVLLTDASPAMVSIARSKLFPLGAMAEIVAAEDIEQFAARHLCAGGQRFDGAFSNFAPLNCVSSLDGVARGLSRLLKPGAPAMLVLFGTFCPGEILTELLRGRPDSALRRRQLDEVPARLASRKFSVTYHRCAELRRSFAPWFVLEKRYGIGITVPPSAAEPWISRQAHLLAAMEALDKLLCRALACFGDHILYQFRRTTEEPEVLSAITGGAHFATGISRGYLNDYTETLIRHQQ